VKAGGAVIDDGGNNIIIAEPLLHDPALGGSADGGLTKLNTGTLTLTSNNLYNGDTIITAGTLALTGVGAITNSANILITNGVVLNASGRSDSKLTLAVAQTLAGNGTVLGNILVNGAVSPGADVTGTITNTGAATFGAGGRYIFDMEDATGQPGTNWDYLTISGTLGILASGANPFVIKLRSIDGDLNDGNPGAADFGTDSSQSWVIATAAGGITNFSANKFTVDTSGFANDLAGGSFSVATNGNDLLLVFASQPAPPEFGSVAVNGTSLVVGGIGGVTGGDYYVLTTTNLMLPLAQWTRALTNQFSTGGSFLFTNDFDPNGPQVFYRLLLP
jgi:autotransporter-associated beta strand protein